jgi:hypothetical protein
MNSHKGDSREVIDPFIVKTGWFVLDVPSCLIRPEKELSQVLRDQIETTIKVLRLNDDDYFVQERCDLMMAFAAGEVSLTYLFRRYPFLASEIERQGLQTTAAMIFKSRSFPL